MTLASSTMQFASKSRALDYQGLSNISSFELLFFSLMKLLNVGEEEISHVIVCIRLGRG